MMDTCCIHSDDVHEKIIGFFNADQAGLFLLNISHSSGTYHTTFFTFVVFAIKFCQRSMNLPELKYLSVVFV